MTQASWRKLLRVMSRTDVWDNDVARFDRMEASRIALMISQIGAGGDKDKIKVELLAIEGGKLKKTDDSKEQALAKFALFCSQGGFRVIPGFKDFVDD